MCHSPTALEAQQLLQGRSKPGHAAAVHSPLVRSPFIPDAEVLMHGVLHVAFIAETLTYRERGGREGLERTRLSTCFPSEPSRQPPGTLSSSVPARGARRETSSHQRRAEQAEVSSQTRSNHLTTYQSRGRTGARRGQGGAGRRGPGPKAHWNFAGRRGRPVPGSASRWHPAGSPPAG